MAHVGVGPNVEAQRTHALNRIDDEVHAARDPGPGADAGDQRRVRNHAAIDRVAEIDRAEPAVGRVPDDPSFTGSGTLPCRAWGSGSAG